MDPLFRHRPGALHLPLGAEARQSVEGSGSEAQRVACRAQEGGSCPRLPCNSQAWAASAQHRTPLPSKTRRRLVSGSRGRAGLAVNPTVSAAGDALWAHRPESSQKGGDGGRSHIGSCRASICLHATDIDEY